MGLPVEEWLTIAGTVLTIMLLEGLLRADLVLLVSLYIELGRGEEGKVTHEKASAATRCETRPEVVHKLVCVRK